MFFDDKQPYRKCPVCEDGNAKYFDDELEMFVCAACINKSH